MTSLYKRVFNRRFSTTPTIVAMMILIVALSLAACGAPSSNQAAATTQAAALTQVAAPDQGATTTNVVVTPEPASASGATGKQVTVKFWHNQGQADSPVLKVLQTQIQKFEATHPNIKIEPSYVQFDDSFQQKLQAAVAGGVPPDVVTLTGAAGFAVSGGAVPLNDYIARDSAEIDFNDFIPGQLKRQQWQGKTYAIPAWADANFLLWWNKDQFKEAGLDPDKPPKTWSELKAFSKKLIKKDASGKIERLGFIPTQNQGWFLAYYYTTGKTELHDTSQTPPKVTFNDADGVRALQFMTDLSDLNGGGAEQAAFAQGFQSGANDPFIMGQVAMTANGNWFYSTLKQYAPNMHYGVALMPVPDEGGTPATTSGGFSYGIPKGAQHADQGWEFIKFLTSKESLLELAKNTTLLPARQSLFSDPFFQKDPVRKVFVDALHYARGWGEGPWQGEVWDVTMVKARDEALYHRKPPKEALDEAAAASQEVINRFFK
jgi:ABC-type glycerol-3-phosphate transport system substrate-binding protein